MSARLDNTVHGMKRGVAGTAVWAAADPFLQRVFDTPYSDVRLMGRAVARGPFRPLWPVAGLVVHLLNGAVFGAAFGFFGGKTRGQALAAAAVENTLLWPLMALADRRHPDRLDGTWPRLLTNPRVIAQGYASHALFALVLGGGEGAESGPSVED